MAERRGDQVKQGHRSAWPSYKEFGSSALHVEFERHIKAAQDAFLKGDNATAEREATQALRFRPTAHLFALMAVVAESKGQYDRASDFRLLQAFLAKDTVLWEELLHEFLSQQLYYKSVVCLQRLTALVRDDAERHRTLQLQLADLLVGLGEIRRAANVLVPLWNRSRCRDFEVFAQLSSLYFQLGKWNSLEGLIASSLKYAFHVDTSQTDAGGVKDGVDDGAPRSGRRSGTKRVHFDDEDGDKGEANNDNTGRATGTIKAEATTSTTTTLPLKKEEGEDGTQLEGRSAEELAASPADDFGFDELMPRPGDDAAVAAAAAAAPASPGSPAQSSSVTRLGSSTPQHSDRASQSLRKHYGDNLVLSTDEEKRNFLTLVNVHTELLNERGKYTETIRLVEMTAAAVGEDLLDLPPDLLTRLGTAYAYQGDLEQQCREVFQHLVETCSMDDYGDVLLDAATTLQKVGMHRDALQLFETITRYHEFRLRRLREDKTAIQAELADNNINNIETPASAVEASQQSLASVLKQVQSAAAASPRVHALRADLAELSAEESELTTVVAAGFYGQARCWYALHDHTTAETMVRKALEYEPSHLQGRLLLGRLRFYDAKDVDGAVAALTPMANEPGLHRLQLGAALVGVFKRANKLIEAVALGVSIFELILSSSEDGDTESVAPGSSVGQRRTVKLYMPSLSRASSAIIPASSLSTMLHGPSSSAAGSTRRLSSSIAASVKASSTVFTQQLRRRGMSALTTTVYGASAAASVAAGWEREQEEARLQDSSTIFRFVHRRRRTSETDDTGKKSAADDEEGDGKKRQAAIAVAPPLDHEAHRRERADAIAHMPAKDFWDTKAEATDATAKSAASEEAEDNAVGNRTARRKRSRRGTKTDSEGNGGSNVNDDRDAGEGGGLGLACATTAGSREDDLAELEAFAEGVEAVVDAEATATKRRRTEQDGGHGEEGQEQEQEQEEEQDQGHEGDEPGLESYELPSLDEISTQFNDPALSKLFLDATMNFSLQPDGESAAAAAAAADPWAAAHQGRTTSAMPSAGSPGLAPELHKVTMREAVEALGRTELVTLATTVVECYSLLGHFSEAKEFAYMTLMKLANRKSLRGSGQGIERPLRTALLQSALAAREAEDAFRVGLNLLLQDSTEEEKDVVIELLHRVLNVCGPAASGGVLLRAVLEGQNEVPMVVLLANRYYISGSFLRALNLYLVALNKRPQDAFLNWMAGLLFVLVSHQRRIRSHEACVSAGVYYLQRYETLVTAVSPARTGEAVYNVARVLHYIRLPHLCIPLYRRVATELPVPDKCSQALQRAAQFNLYYLLRWHSGNRPLALSMLPFADATAGCGTGEEEEEQGQETRATPHSPFA